MRHTPIALSAFIVLFAQAAFAEETEFLVPLEPNVAFDGFAPPSAGVGRPDAIDPATALLPRRTHVFQPFLAGSSVAVDPVTGNVWVADSENGAVVVSDREGQRVLRRIEVGEGPEQVAVGPDGTAYVTLRGSGKLAAIAPGGGCVSRVAVGEEPFGVAVAPDGKTVYVSLAAEGQVVALAAPSLTERFRVHVDPEPRGLALRSAGDKLFVAHLLGRSVSVIDVAPGRSCAGSVRTISLQTPPDTVPPDETGVFSKRGRFLNAAASGGVPNQTFALALSPEGDELYAPHVLEDTGGQVPTQLRSGGYGGGVPAPIVAAVTRFDADSERLVDRFRPGFAFRQAVRESQPMFRSDALSQPRAIAADPAVTRLYVAGQGSDEVWALATGTVGGRPVAVVNARIDLEYGSGPRGVAVSADGTRVYVHAALHHELVVARVPPGLSESKPSLAQLALGEDPMPPAAQHGRQLFFAAGDTRVSSGGMLACASCHPEGRQDGMVWHLSDGPRRTPILANRLTGTAPYDWRGAHATIEQHIQNTVVSRLGGSGLPPADLADLRLYLTDYCKMPARSQHPLTALEERGRELFGSDGAACADCHDPAGRFSDGREHDIASITQEEESQRFTAIAIELAMLPRPQRPSQLQLLEFEISGGKNPITRFKREKRQFTATKQKLEAETRDLRLAYNTPTLLAISRNAPYFHDGSAETLRDVITTANWHDRMGTTSNLSPCDVDALVAYLDTL